MHTDRQAVRQRQTDTKCIQADRQTDREMHAYSRQTADKHENYNYGR